ncbi:hypothetical protein CXF78_00855, partial [Shewanella sp. 11B5]|uniref:hypothetical protein n=1 Tax=Shewanella sp. 11B5 TaxID=2058298 RepID=UPI000CAA20F3
MNISFKEIRLDWLCESELACSGGVVRKALTLTSADNDNISVCKFIFFKQTNRPICMLFIDALYIGKSLNDKIELIANNYNLTCFVSATHTHYMPNISNEYKHFGYVNLDYLKFLCDKIENVFREFSLSAKYESVISITTLSDNYPDVLYRRRSIKRPYIDIRRLYNHISASWIRKLKFKVYGTIMAPNKQEGVVSPSTILTLTTKNTSVVLFSNATHPTNGFSDSSSRDIYSIVENKFAELGSSFIGAQGFASDLKINSTVKIKNVKSLVRTILFGDSFKSPSKFELDRNVSLLLRSSFHPTELSNTPCSEHDLLSTELWLGTYDHCRNKIIYNFSFLKIN